MALLNQKILFNLFNSMRPQARDVYEDETAIALVSPGKPSWIWFKNSAAGGEDTRRCFYGFINQFKLADTGIIANKKIIDMYKESYAKKLIAYYMNGPGNGSEAAGVIRTASVDDTNLVNEWIAAFYKEALAHELPEIEKRINENKKKVKLFIWDDGGPCAMGMLCEPHNKFCRINLVYTPAHLRRRGYAKAVVSALVKTAQKKGDAPFLFTDAQNTAANILYKGLGFKEVGRFYYFNK